MSSRRRAVEREDSDENLMARYAAGDTEAFDELFSRYEPRAYAFFARRTNSPARADDLYQELFLRIHRARDRYDPTRAFSPWFFQIANRLLIDDCRRSFRSHEVPIEGLERGAEQSNAESVAADREQVDRLLHALTSEERYVVLSSRVEGIGYPELAEHLGKSAGAVKKMASRAIQRLRLEAASAEPVRVPAS